MVPLYLFCLIVGGGLLLFSLLGHHEGGGADAHAEVDARADTDTDAGPATHLGHETDIASDFLSIRSLVYLLSGFGATGLLLETLTDASAGTAMVWSLATGLVAALAAAVVYGWLKRSESGRMPDTSDYLVGLSAQVVLPVLDQRRGKVRVIAAGREIELLARLHGREDAECPRGSTVVIVDVQGDTALVTPAPSLSADLSEE
jgi:membrane protein implicated in regulation of membrane protease activity